MREPTSLSLLLKRYRMAAGLSQEALAQRADLSTRAISDLERGLHRLPHTTTLDLLATALALSPSQRALLLAAARPDLAPLLYEPNDVPSSDFLWRIPTPLTPLIGRDHEYGQCLALLSEGTARLVTIIGPSGVGKTRLALQIGRDSTSVFRDGAVFVDLASIRDAALVPSVIAQELRLREQSDISLEQQIRAHLHDRRMLLLLDNFEQVIESALFIADLLQWCPQITCLVTSRSPLRLRGEYSLPLGPLSLENAIVLFRERANAVRPNNVLTVSETAVICERVDCLPLAIEIVASQVTLLSPPQILEQLDQHMTLALEGARDLPDRQRTMAAAIGWSYELLTPAQRQCFRSLGVFAGGATLDAARAVCWRDDTVTDTETMLALAALVDASLVHVETARGGRPRFYLLELLREYALERLRADGEEETCRMRHARYYAARAQSLMSYGFGPRDDADRMGQELPNARAALEWALERRDAELGLRLAGFSRIWFIRGVAGETEHWFSAMLALDAEARAAGAPAAPLALRVQMLYGYGRSLINYGRIEQAEVFAQEAVALARQIGDHDGLSNALATVGLIAQAKGDTEQAITAFTESVAQAGSDVSSEARYRALYYLAEVARHQGDLDRAHMLLDQALSGAEAADNAWDRAIMTTMLAHLERQQQANAPARRHFLDSLSRFHSFGSVAFFAWCLEGYCALLCAEQDYARAIRLFAAAATLRRQAHAPLPTAERDAFEHSLSCARDALGQPDFDVEWAAGSPLTMTAALEEAMMSGS
ncbi:MAG TPA: tetratricopeptide repeat protein [Ktedonobacterales bacterium]|jgi:predicted ATPase/DNA-binding XRE family transcriptional regulator